MKRVLIALVISIFLGVFGTIGTAWLFAALSDDDGGMDSYSLMESIGSWSVFASRRIGVWDGAAMILFFGLFRIFIFISAYDLDKLRFNPFYLLLAIVI